MEWLRRVALLACLCVSACSAMAATMEYRYWDWGKTKKRDDYQIAVLRLALEKTVPSHGPYAITRVVQSFSTQRLRREVFEGKRVNVHVGPWRVQDPANPYDRNIRIDIPMMGGLLGYRSLFVRRDDLPKFQQIERAEQLKALVAGQGRGWMDVEIYRHNGYRVDDHANLPTLLAMLLNNRFDYLPMSVMEVNSVLALNPQLAPRLALVPGMLIQYEFPAVFYVSASQPKLASRLEQGLAMASKDGSLSALLERSFRPELAALQRETTREFVLENPFLPPRMRVTPVSFRR